MRDKFGREITHEEQQCIKQEEEDRDRYERYKDQRDNNDYNDEMEKCSTCNNFLNSHDHCPLCDY